MVGGIRVGRRQLLWALVAGTLLASLLSMQIGNARRVAALTATPSPVSTAGDVPADLVVLSAAVTIPSSDCSQRSNLGTRATVKNNGLVAAGSFVVRVNGVDAPVAGLASGATTSVWVPGYRYGTPTDVVVDALNQVAEGNESNNTFSQMLPIPTPIPPCTPTSTPYSTSTRTPTSTAIVGDLGYKVISGQVTNAQGTPIAGATVSCSHFSYYPRTVCSGSRTTDASGSFSFGSVFLHDTDRVTVSASAPGYVGQSIQRGGYQTWSNPVFTFALAAGATPTFTATITPTSTSCQPLTINGRVISTTTGAGIGGARVTATTSPVMRTFTATTAADGSYTLSVPAVSSYACTVVSLKAEAAGYTTVTRSINSAQLRTQPTQNFSLWPTNVTPTRTRTRTGTPPTATRTRTRTATRTSTPTATSAPAWTAWTSYALGARVSYAGVLYECLQAHTSQPGWEPPNTPALWQRL